MCYFPKLFSYPPFSRGSLPRQNCTKTAYCEKKFSSENKILHKKLIWKHLCFHSSKQHMTFETNLFHPCRSGQRLAAWSVSAATKYSSAANFLPPFIFPALSLRNSLLCRIPCYQQPALHDAFPPSEHATGAGKGSLLASSPQQHSDKHTPKTFKSSSPTQVHFFF